MNDDVSPCIGRGIALSFSHLQALLLDRLSAQTALSPGMLLVARAEDSAWVVLRAQQLQALPEADQAEYRRCQQWWQEFHAGREAPPLADSLGLLVCEILGAFDPGQSPLRFSATVPLHHRAGDYRLFEPRGAIADMLINGLVQEEGKMELGLLRPGEDLSYLQTPHPVYISMKDIRGQRSAMFGKTRLGKSNVVKLIVQGMLDFTRESRNVGQIIFDVNGEYANTNPQDGQAAIATANPDRCLAYFLTDVPGNPQARLLRFNFYERPHDVMEVIRELLPPDAAAAPEIRNLLTVRLPALQRGPAEQEFEFQRKLRKVMLFWTVLSEAGFESHSDHLKAMILAQRVPLPFNPGFSQTLRKAAYQAVNNTAPPSAPYNFFSMAVEMRTVARFSLAYPNDPALNPNGQFIFDNDEEVLAEFLCKNEGANLVNLRACLQYHSPVASDFSADILQALNAGQTVIINLGSANEQIIRYFAKYICLSIFHEQERKFVGNCMGDHYLQIYFEEAHMIFPPNAGDVINVYSRFAKEGAKFNIGIVYSTQSPTTVNRDLLSQTENFFIGHLSSVTETDYLSSVQSTFASCAPTILRSRTPGLMHVLTHSHRYVIAVQAHRFDRST